MRKIHSFLTKLLNGVIESRRRQAARQVAQYLVMTNADFRRTSVGELEQRILADNHSAREIYTSVKGV
jgi:hypothetical protein